MLFRSAEARAWPEAIEQLERAIRAADGDCPLRVLEQIANCRARLAADEALAARRRGSAMDSAQAKAREERLQAVLDEFEPLCRRAPTVERLSLLGSTHKRHALVAASPAVRLKALDACATAYRQAFEAGGSKDAYPFTNWASTVLVAAHLDAARSGLEQIGRAHV